MSAIWGKSLDIKVLPCKHRSDIGRHFGQVLAVRAEQEFWLAFSWAAMEVRVERRFTFWVNRAVFTELTALNVDMFEVYCVYILCLHFVKVYCSQKMLCRSVLLWVPKLHTVLSFCSFGVPFSLERQENGETQRNTKKHRRALFQGERHSPTLKEPLLFFLKAFGTTNGRKEKSLAAGHRNVRRLLVFATISTATTPYKQTYKDMHRCCTSLKDSATIVFNAQRCCTASSNCNVHQQISMKQKLLPRLWNSHSVQTSAIDWSH